MFPELVSFFAGDSILHSNLQATCFPADTFVLGLYTPVGP